MAPAATPNPLQARVELHRHTQRAPLIPYAVDSVAFWSIDPRSVPFTPLEHRPHNLIAIGGGRGEERREEKLPLPRSDQFGGEGDAIQFRSLQALLASSRYCLDCRSHVALSTLHVLEDLPGQCEWRSQRSTAFSLHRVCSTVCVPGANGLRTLVKVLRQP